MQQPTTTFETLSQSKGPEAQRFTPEGNNHDQANSKPANVNEARPNNTPPTDSSGAGAASEASRSLPLELLPPNLPGPSNQLVVNQSPKSSAVESKKIAKHRLREFPLAPSDFPQTAGSSKESVVKPPEQLTGQNANHHDRSGTIAKRKRKKAPVKKKQGASITRSSNHLSHVAFLNNNE